MLTILYIICCIHWLSVQSQMFTETTAALSNDWTGTLAQNSGYNQITNDALLCPGSTNDNCWDIASQGYVERTVNTIGYTNVELTYSMSSDSGLTGQKRCDLEYSKNGIDYTQIDTIDFKNIDKPSITFNTWTVDNIAQLKIRLTNVNGGCSCYFNDLILSGSTAAPTTSVPTTVTPTTTIPTTATPTTVSPTTATPTTATPTTAAPTTTSPTTTSPTTTAPTVNPTTNNPTTSQPTTATPTTVTPTTATPTGVPTTAQPTTANPTTKNPTDVPTNIPTTYSPTTTSPTSHPTAPTFAPFSWCISNQNYNDAINVRSLTSTIVPSSVVDISATVTWKDQGYGFQKGTIRMHQYRNAQLLQTVRLFGKAAPHTLTTDNTAAENCNFKDVFANDELRFDCVIGTGGGHSLQINSLCITIIFGPNICPTWSPTKEPTSNPTISPTFPTNAPSMSPTQPPSLAPTITPTQPPSITPTQPPSLSPTSIPTKFSLSPTNAPSITPTQSPSIAPTQPPSITPTQPPSIAPSITPTTPPSISPTQPPTDSTSHPSQTPTITTITPTGTPSAQPTAPTTYSPTQSNPHSCGSYRWCWTIYFYPTKSFTTHLVNIIINDDSTTTYADITFIPRDGDCIDPLITFEYEQIDIGMTSEYIHVYNNNGASIQQCQGNGGSDSQCGVWWTCLNQRSLGIPIIPRDSSYKISLTESSNIDDLCSGIVSSNARLTLICQGTGAPTVDPTKTPTTTPTQTTNPPTNAPSISPTLSPTSIPTKQSINPTNAPSITPTQPPSIAPTQPPSISPTNPPSISPSNSPTQPPSLTPSISPTQPPSNSPTQPPSLSPTYIPTRSTIQPTKTPTETPSKIPTNNPSATTNMPSKTPTNNPSVITNSPTPRPTYGVENCPTPTMSDRYCYRVDIFPQSGIGASETIIIQQPDNNVNSEYEIFFTPRNGPCINPQITLIYEQIDISSTGEYIDVYEDSYSEGYSLRRCQGNGGSDTQCNTFWPCFSNLALINTYINVDEEYNIRLYSPSANDAFCTTYHPYKINAQFTIICDNSIFTYSPTNDPTTPFPTRSTPSPTVTTLQPTTNPTVTLCGKAAITPNAFCETQSIYSSSIYNSNTFTVYITNYGISNYISEPTYIYFTATNICYSPYITVTYELINTQPLTILNHNEQSIGQCAAANSNTQCTNNQIDCITDYSLNIPYIPINNIYIITIFGEYLTNDCGNSYTTNARIVFTCDTIPTPKPTKAPTIQTINPTTGIPTKITNMPTPSPTNIRVDGIDLFYILIISHWRISDRSYSLILLTMTNDYIDLTLTKLLKLPLNFPTDIINSITELKEYSFCYQDHCLQFWNINYQVEQCNFEISGDFKYLLKAGCVGAFSQRKSCLELLRDEGFNENTLLTTLVTTDFIFKDKICSLQVYKHLFKYDFLFYKDSKFEKKRNDNKKYKKGDIVYIELDIDRDVFFNAYDITINNIFACSSNRTIDLNLTETEMINGIGGCLLNNYKLPLILISNDYNNNENNQITDKNKFSFQIPTDLNIKKNKLFIQIQATISIDVSRRRRNLLQLQESQQIRHFMTHVELGGNVDAVNVSNGISGGATAGIIIAIILCCIVIIIIFYFVNNRNKNKIHANTSKQNLELETIGGLEKVTSLSANSPRGDGDDNITNDGYVDGNASPVPKDGDETTKEFIE